MSCKAMEFKSQRKPCWCLEKAQLKGMAPKLSLKQWQELDGEEVNRGPKKEQGQDIWKQVGRLI